jgi:hypothetical protein
VIGLGGASRLSFLGSFAAHVRQILANSATGTARVLSRFFCGAWAPGSPNPATGWACRWCLVIGTRRGFALALARIFCGPGAPNFGEFGYVFNPWQRAGMLSASVAEVSCARGLAGLWATLRHQMLAHPGRGCGDSSGTKVNVRVFGVPPGLEVATSPGEFGTKPVDELWAIKKPKSGTRRKIGSERNLCPPFSKSGDSL